MDRRQPIVRRSLQRSLGIPRGDFTLSLSDPPACTVGFCPHRNGDLRPTPRPLTRRTGCTPSSPGFAHCGPRSAKLSLHRHPGKRAPTVELCNDPKGFQPLTMRQHTIGPYPLDPNLIAQGVPIDGRALPNQLTFGPVDGTPPPPIAAPPGAEPPTPPMPGNDESAGVAGVEGAAPVAPSAFGPVRSK